MRFSEWLYGLLHDFLTSMGEACIMVVIALAIAFAVALAAGWVSWPF